METEPRTFGRYRLLERLGGGGMAEVWRAEVAYSADVSKVVALKMIREDLVKVPQFLSLFIDEARITSRLSHANVAQVFDFGEEAGRPFLAMELVEGPDLETILQRARELGQFLPQSFCAYVVSEVARGLAAAHGLSDAQGRPYGIVHRDVSPQNVLLSYAGEVKITDFGIARARDKLTQTETGTVMGKFRYMSPEQVQGMQLDARSDIFSCGILLYELITGLQLFDGRTSAEVVDQIRYKAVPALVALRRDVDPALETVLRETLARDPAARCPDAGTLARDLERYLHVAHPLFTRDEVVSLVGALLPRRSPGRVGQIAFAGTELATGRGTPFTAPPVAAPQGTVLPSTLAPIAASPAAPPPVVTSRGTVPPSTLPPIATSPSATSPSSALPAATSPSSASPSTLSPSTAMPVVSPLVQGPTTAVSPWLGFTGGDAVPESGGSAVTPSQRRATLAGTGAGPLMPQATTQAKRTAGSSLVEVSPEAYFPQSSGPEAHTGRDGGRDGTEVNDADADGVPEAPMIASSTLGRDGAFSPLARSAGGSGSRTGSATTGGALGTAPSARPVSSQSSGASSQVSPGASSSSPGALPSSPGALPSSRRASSISPAGSLAARAAPETPDTAGEGTATLGSRPTRGSSGPIGAGQARSAFPSLQDAPTQALGGHDAVLTAPTRRAAPRGASADPGAALPALEATRTQARPGRPSDPTMATRRSRGGWKTLLALAVLGVLLGGAALLGLRWWVEAGSRRSGGQALGQGIPDGGPTAALGLDAGGLGKGGDGGTDSGTFQTQAVVAELDRKLQQLPILRGPRDARVLRALAAGAAHRLMHATVDASGHRRLGPAPPEALVLPRTDPLAESVSSALEVLAERILQSGELPAEAKALLRPLPGSVPVRADLLEQFPGTALYVLSHPESALALEMHVLATGSAKGWRQPLAGPDGRRLLWPHLSVARDAVAKLGELSPRSPMGQALRRYLDAYPRGREVRLGDLAVRLTRVVRQPIKKSDHLALDLVVDLWNRGLQKRLTIQPLEWRLHGAGQAPVGPNFWAPEQIEPIEPGRSLSLTVTYSVPVAVHAQALVLTVPQAGGGALWFQVESDLLP